MFILIKLLWTLSDTLYSRYWACLLFRYKTSSNITGKQGAIKVYYFCFTPQNWNTLEAQQSAQRFAALDQVSRRILKNPGSFIMLLTGAHRQQEKSQPEGFSVQSESASKQTCCLPKTWRIKLHCRTSDVFLLLLWISFWRVFLYSE